MPKIEVVQKWSYYILIESKFNAEQTFQWSLGAEKNIFDLYPYLGMPQFGLTPCIPKIEVAQK